MARVLFIQKEASEKFGVMSLSAVLKQAGHQTRMYVQLLEKEPVAGFVKKWQPDIIAFSITTVEKEWALAMADRIKKSFPVLAIFGGAEPTHNPGIINHPVVDIICCGEGERGLVSLLNRLEKGRPLAGIKNFWVKEKGRVYKSSLGRLVADLERLPLPDRELYYRYPVLKEMSIKKFRLESVICVCILSTGVHRQNEGVTRWPRSVCPFATASSTRPPAPPGGRRTSS